MHHLILGYGYCGYFLAQELLKKQQKVTAISRHLDPQMTLAGLNHRVQDLKQAIDWSEEDAIIYYLIPPGTVGDTDAFLKQFLSKNTIKAKKLIYFGSSGVYGDHQGGIVDEESPCPITNPRQLRRLDAEGQWLDYCTKHNITPVLLRIGGIYGPKRLPIEAALAKTPVIETAQAPLINHIFVKDLASLAFKLSQTEQSQGLFNVADGLPKPMGTLQQLVARALKIDPAPFESWQEAWDKASAMKREFMQGSKQLSIARLKSCLEEELILTPIEEAVQQSIQNNSN